MIDEGSNGHKQVLSRRNVALGIAFTILLYGYFVWGISTNPPGFYVDESCIAYNGYLIAKTGTAENGTRFPLYFQCYTQGYSQYMSAAQPYALALLYLFVPPSVISARLFAATLVFLSILLLGALAARVTGRRDVGAIVVFLGVLTPWLFEIGRLVQETFVLIFSIVLFLYLLYRAYQRGNWGLGNIISIALSLTLITYCYATGRMIGPLFGLGLLIFAKNVRSFLAVVATGFFYGLTIVPMVVVYFTRPEVISGRFWSATNISTTASVLKNIGTVASAFLEDISLKFFLFDGDQHMRHHVPGTGELLVGTFALGILGIIIVLIRHRKSAWWWFILYGAFASLLPGAITTERWHAMRDLAFPIFFLLLTAPAISWLLATTAPTIDRMRVNGLRTLTTERSLRLGLLSALLILTAVQSVQFRYIFDRDGKSLNRSQDFDGAYPRVFERALAEGDRPIYLDEGPVPAYIHAYWYGAIQGLDRSNFVHLLDHQEPPVGALVLTSEGSCANCQIIVHDENYMLYRKRSGDAEIAVQPKP